MEDVKNSELQKSLPWIGFKRHRIWSQKQQKALHELYKKRNILFSGGLLDQEQDAWTLMKPKGRNVHDTTTVSSSELFLYMY